MLIVGIGNAARGDDAAGVEILSRLKEGPEVSLLDTGTVPESYVGKIRESGAEMVVLVDAVDFGGQAGAVALFEHLDVPKTLYTTHRAPLGILMQYIKTECKADVLLLGIQPKDTRIGAPMSPEVRASIDAVAELINRDAAGAIDSLREGLNPQSARDGAALDGNRKV